MKKSEKKELVNKMVVVICLVIMTIVLFLFPAYQTNPWAIIGMKFSSHGDYYEAVGAVAIIVAIASYYFNNIRSRKEKAVEAMMSWSNRLTETGSATRKIVDSLSKDDCKKLYAEESFVLYEKSQIRRLYIVFADNEEVSKQIKRTLENAENKKISFEVNEVLAAKMRWIIIDYLNSLESVLIAWKLNTVNRKVIEQELGYLVQDSWATLLNFRQAMGGQDAYPAITAFENRMHGQ